MFDVSFRLKLGSIASVHNEEDEEDNRKSPLPRSRSPSPFAQAPDEDSFEDFTYRKQVACVRPIIDLIIRGEYQWAKPRHDAFIAGGQKRQALTRNMQIGDLNGEEVNKIAYEIRRWALRGERWGPKMRDEVDVATLGQQTEDVEEDSAAEVPVTQLTVDAANTPSDKVLRPKGGSEYEALSGSDRSQVCNSRS